MSSHTLQLTPELYEYLHSVSLREPEILQQLREETARQPRAAMQISPEQGQFMSLVIQILGAKKILEIGVFTGYSSTIMAMALPEDGQLDACDVDADFTSIARRYWKAAGIENKISLYLAPALDTLKQLKSNGNTGTYDLAFIDADKVNYLEYYQHCMDLIRPGGLVLVDNVLWDGCVADPSQTDEDTEGIRNLNRHLHQDQNVDISLLPIGDGLSIARKRI
jgi:predicted O-methyltransferase YrrM